MNTVICQKLSILKHSSCKNIGIRTQEKSKIKDAQEQPLSGGLPKKELPLHVFISLLNHQTNLVYL